MTDDGPILVPQPIILLGATSLIGQALVALADRPALICVSRSASDGRALRPGDTWIQADLSTPWDADGSGGAVSALGLAPIWVVAAAAPDLARQGVRRIVAFSSTSRWTKQASPDPAERKVAQSLADGEAAFIAACEDHGVAWTLLRPTLIYLEGRDGNVSRLAGLIRRLGVLPLAGQGGGLRQPVHAEDLAVAALAALVRPETQGRAYDLPGGETLSYRAMAVRIFESLGRPPRVLSLPPWLWALAFAVARPFLPGATATMGSRMEKDLTFDGSAAEQDFSWRPRRFCPRFPDAA